jgi:preprotein translocase subunit SecG
MSFQIVLIIHMLLAFGLIALILMQHGKGADAGAAFGAGASGSVFGARGANSFMYKLTASIAVGFFITSLTLAFVLLSIVGTSVDNTSFVLASTVGTSDGTGSIITWSITLSDFFSVLAGVAR